MKTLFILFLIGTTCGSAFAQITADTTYLDGVGKETTKENASQYRLSKKDGDSYQVTDYYLDGVVKMKGTYSSLDPETKNGSFFYYTSEGLPESECTYQANKLEGEYRSFKTIDNMGDLSVWLWQVKNYHDSKLDGSFVTYDQAKRLRRQDSYKAGTLVEGKCLDEHGDKIAYFPPMEMPQFKGGEVGLARYLQANIVYPYQARDHGIEGKVYLTFIINEDGSVNNVKVVRGVEASLDAESLRVVKKMPRWIPGTEEGLPIKVRFNLPIDFKLH